MSTDSIQELINVEAKKLAKKMVQNVEVKPGKSMYQLGAKLFIRTVTFHYVGKVSFLSEHEVVLDDASWVADSGRFSEALKTGKLSEVEPYPSLCSIGRATIADASPWHHDLPRGVK